MSSRFEEGSDASDNESEETRKSSVLPFQFIDIEAVESDGDGGDLDYVIVDSVDDKQENEDTTMNDFIADDTDSNDENENNSELSHMQIRNQLNKELEEKASELILNDTETPDGDNKINNNDIQKQQLLQQLTKPKENTQKQGQKRKRYYDLLANNKNIIVDDTSSESEEDDSEYVDSSDENSDSEMNVDTESDSESDDNDESDTKIDGLSELSKLEFEKLLSHTMVNLALKLEENDNKNMSQQINPFINMDDQISLEVNNELNMSELLSFISDDDDNNDYDNDMEHVDVENINNPKDFETIIPFEKSHNILPEPSTFSSNHPLNLRKSKLNTTTLSNKNEENNTFIQEEIRLAENTMKRAITSKMNMEQKNFAPPLSSLDRRVRKKRKGDNAGKAWFNMSAGKLTPQNKLHFLMLKYRHMLYRDYKPSKVKEDFVPKYFEMGTIIEGPTEFYSSRLTRRQRRSSWANQYLSDPTTKQWLEEKTRRAQHRIRRPGNKFWAPMKKLNVNNRYKLRKKIIRHRKKRSWKKK